MMSLNFPRDAVAELYMNGWTDVTTYVRQTSPVTITRGRANEQGTVAPTTLTCTFDNATGNFSPSNPLGTFYGLLGHNTPFRWRLRTAKDAFGRTVANGWGTADVGGTWLSIGTSSDFSVTGNAGRHSVSAANSYRLSYLTNISHQNVYVKITTSLSFTDVTGAAVEPATICLRGSGTDDASSEYYMLRVTITADEAVQVSVIRRRATVDTVLAGPTTVADLTHSSGQSLTVVGMIEDQTIRGKVYASTSAEPFDWAITFSDTSSSAIATAGWIGVRSGVATGNTNTKPIVFTYDNLDVSVVRFCGESSEFKPRWDESHHTKWVEYQASGLMRRLGHPKRAALQSAPTRYFTGVGNSSFTATDYWPLDDAPDSDTPGLNLIPGGTNAYLERNTGGTTPIGALKWGQTAGSLLSAPYAAEVMNEGSIVCLIRNTALGTSWSVSWAQRISPDAGGNVFLRNVDSTQDIAFTFNTDGTYRVDLSFSSTTIFTTEGTYAANGVDDSWHTYSFTAYRVSGTTIGYLLSVDGGAIQSTTASTFTFAPLRRVDLVGPSPIPNTTNGTSSYSSLAITSTKIDVGSPTVANLMSQATLGWPGETALGRAIRLASEQSVTLDYVGDPTTTALMGAQRTLPFYDLLVECTSTDQGTLYEPLGVVGLGIKSLRSYYGVDAALTLNYASQQVARPLEPNLDDQVTANDVTASRVGGAKYNAVLASGELNVFDPNLGTGGVGRYTQSLDINPQFDSQLPDAAWWLIHIGTVKEDRYPKVRINLAATAFTTDSTLAAHVLDVGVDERITIQNLSVVNIYNDIDQIARGYTETFRDQFGHEIAFNTAPYKPYRVGQWNDGTSRWDDDTTTLTSTINSTDTGAKNFSITSGILWTTDATQFPMNFEMGGEVFTVSAISGSSSPQSFTISARSVNGVVIGHAAGTRVRLATSTYWGR